MEVIAVRGVVFRPQDGAEPLAGAALHDAQELAFGSGAAVPVVQHADPASVGEVEGPDIDRLGRGMGGSPPAPGSEIAMHEKLPGPSVQMPPLTHGADAHA